MAALAVAWVVVGGTAFPRTIIYILAYPPKLAFRRWALLIAFTPGILQVVTTLRTVFLFYTAAAVSGLVVEIGSNKTMLFAAMVALSVFLATHLYRSFRKAYSSSVLSPFRRW